MNLSALTDMFDSSDDDKFDHLGVLKELSAVISVAARVSGNQKLARAVTAISIATSVSTVANHFHAAYKRRKNSEGFTVKISETDRVFTIAEKWLNDALHDDQRRSVFVRTETPDSENYSSLSSGLEVSVPDTARSQKKGKVSLSMLMDGAVTQTVTIAGHRVKISTTNPIDSDEKKKKSYYTARSIVIYCQSVEARNAVVEQLEQEAQKIATQPPTFNTAMGWGSFRPVSDIPRRPLESVILKEGQMDRILTFLRRFLDNEAEYVRLGIPYRTGMMLYGNPGSGKSSTASTIAYTLGLNIYYISLSGLDGDDSLTRSLNEIPPYSLAILEDVDVYSAVKTRGEGVDSDSGGVTLAGLLNALDGFNSPHGVVTVMTTNHIDAIDPALIRPGRVDLMEELNELDDFQLRGICQYFLGSVPENLPNVAPVDGITSAEVIDKIRKHIPHVENSADDIVNFVTSKMLDFTK